MSLVSHVNGYFQSNYDKFYKSLFKVFSKRKLLTYFGFSFFIQSSNNVFFLEMGRNKQDFLEWSMIGLDSYKKITG